MKQPKFGESQYEAHITLGKTVNSEELLELLKKHNFKVVDLAVINHQDLTNECFDTITTSHSSNLQELVNRTFDEVILLQKNGYEVLRYKIESTVIDSKYQDTFGVLDGNSEIM